MTLQRDNVAMTRTMKRDRLVGNFHLVEVIQTCWKIFFKLCKLLFLQHQHGVDEHDFFNPMKDQKIQRKKCDNVLHVDVELF
jgi:hypothetical protein